MKFYPWHLFPLDLYKKFLIGVLGIFYILSSPREKIHTNVWGFIVGESIEGESTM
jgi:hypothetical protein